MRTKLAGPAVLVALTAVMAARAGRAQGDEARRLAGHSGGAVAVRYTADGRLLMVAGGRRATVFSVPEERVVATLEGFDGGIEAAALAPDGTRAAVVSEGVLHVVEVETKKELWARGADKDRVLSVAFSPDGSLVATQGPGLATHLCRADTGEEPFALPPPPSSPDDPGAGEVVFAPDGKSLAACGPGESVRVLDATSGRLVGRLEGRFSTAAFAPDGKTLAALSAKHERLVLWDPASGKPGRAVDTVEPQAVAVAWGRAGIVTSDGLALTLRDASGRPTGTLDGVMGKLPAFAIAPDGARIAAADVDGTILLLDPSNARAPEKPGKGDGKQGRPAPPEVKGGPCPPAVLEALDLAANDLKKRIIRVEFPKGERDTGGKAPVLVMDVRGPDGKPYDFTAKAAIVRALERSEHVVPVGGSVRAFHAVIATVATVKADEKAKTSYGFLTLQLVNLEGRYVEAFVIRELAERDGQPVEVARPEGRAIEAEAFAKDYLTPSEMRECAERFGGEFGHFHPDKSFLGPQGRVVIKITGVDKAGGKIEVGPFGDYVRSALVNSIRYWTEVEKEHEPIVKEAEALALAASEGAAEKLRIAPERARATVRVRVVSDKLKERDGKERPRTRLLIEMLDGKQKDPVAKYERELQVKK